MWKSRENSDRLTARIQSLVRLQTPVGLRRLRSGQLLAEGWYPQSALSAVPDVGANHVTGRSHQRLQLVRLSLGAGERWGSWGWAGGAPTHQGSDKTII